MSISVQLDTTRKYTHAIVRKSSQLRTIFAVPPSHHESGADARPMVQRRYTVALKL